MSDPEHEALNLAPEEGARDLPLAALHAELGATFAPFAGWAMPLRYPAGILAEHVHCRTHAALFDVSHMGQGVLSGAGDAQALERVSPGDLTSLAAGQLRYAVLLNEAGGIVDDLIVGRLPGGGLSVVMNASRAATDIATISAVLADARTLAISPDRALFALQGPQAATVMARHCADAAGLAFMTMAETTVAGAPARVSRCGYTGEDGFEISVPLDHAEALARTLLAEPEVAPAGLGARDSLRLEAGLPLHGHDIDELTTPIEAGLDFAVARRRRAAWDFVGGAVLRDQVANGPPRLRVGLDVLDRTPVRAGAVLVAADGTRAGSVTSGGFGPTIGAPVAMGYVRRDLAAPGTELSAMVRGKPVAVRVRTLPFVPHRYVRNNTGDAA